MAVGCTQKSTKIRMIVLKRLVTLVFSGGCTVIDYCMEVTINAGF